MVTLLYHLAANAAQQPGPACETPPTTWLLSVRICWDGLSITPPGVPLPGLALRAIGIALEALVVQFAASRVLWLLFFFMISYLQTHQDLKIEIYQRAWWQFLAVVLTLPGLTLPFSVLTAGLYVGHGPVIFLFFVVGLILVNVLTNRLSPSAERNRQHLRQLEQLDRLGRALLEAPYNLPNLPDLLKQYVPAMFPYCVIEIRILPDRIVLHEPPDRPGLNESVTAGGGLIKKPSFLTIQKSCPGNRLLTMRTAGC